ncbi:MAG TPA: ribonuclease P protein component [Flavobacteriales bacterium]|nr:ribonuclease P protein component [Flavobacteriales bacterium]
MTDTRNQMVQRATFSKHERLRGKLRVQEVMRTGKSIHETPFRLVGKIMALPTASPSQIAFAVPKRNVPLAVNRNRMKRLMREAFRTNKHRWNERLTQAGVQCAWLVVFQGKTPVTPAETRLKITRSLDRWMEQHG